MIGFLGIGKHSKLKTLLSSYLDDQVSPGERGEVEEHIATCSECRRDLETLRMSVDILRGLPQLETAKLFRLEAAPEPLRASGLPAWATGLATSAAAVLLAVLVIGETLDVFRQAGAVEPEVVVKEARAEAETAVTDVAVPTAGVEAERAAVEEPDVERADEPAAPPVVVEEMAVESAVAAAAPVAAAADAAVGAAPEPVRPVEFEATGEEEKEPLAAPAAERQLRDQPPEVAEAKEEKEEAASLSQAAPELATEATTADEAKAEAAAPETEVASPPAAAPAPEEGPDEGQDGAATMDEGLVSPGEPDTKGGAVTLPLRQLQIAAGGLVAVLLATTAWLARRRRRHVP